MQSDVVKNFKPANYVGKWEDVASIPQPWEPAYSDSSRKCSGATAIYKFESSKEGSISVTNTCYNKAGMPTGSITGTAKLVNPNYGKFILVLYPMGLPLGIKADYLVHATDYNTYAMVGTSSRDALWILARPNKKISQNIYNELVKYATRLKYPTHKLKLSQARPFSTLSPSFTNIRMISDSHPVSNESSPSRILIESLVGR